MVWQRRRLPPAPVVEEVGAFAEEGRGRGVPPWLGRPGRGRDISPEASTGPQLRDPARGRPRELALGLAVPEGGSHSFDKPAERRRTGRPKPHHAAPQSVDSELARPLACGPRALDDPKQGCRAPQPLTSRRVTDEWPPERKE